MTLKEQVIKYIITGCACVLLDGLLYLLLLFFQLPIVLARTVSAVVIVLLGYFINRKWTFQADSSVWIFIKYWVLYTISIGVNVFTNSYIVKIFGESSIILTFAFLVATFISICITFSGLKLWVFRS